MGNANTTVTTGVKQQGSSEAKLIYSLIDLKGGGELVQLMKKANMTKDFKAINHKISELKKSMYNDGNGKKIPIETLVRSRNQERPQGAQLEQTKHTEKEIDNKVHTNDKITDKKQYRELCWKIEECGTVGESILHLCLLNATSLHADLAKRLLRAYPKLVVDIYTSEEYYGETVLHMAVVNEDPAMVKFLLDNGVNYDERCCGNFFCPDDQKLSRTDSLDHEWPDVCRETNYEGYTYWGEYALSFAACLGQEECVRLLIAKGADPNKQDVNGNTVLHMLIIHDKKSTQIQKNSKEMFELLYNLGGDLRIMNRQGFTPLTLAAKLARKAMYDYILEIERSVSWLFGDVTCAGYPLEHIDTIGEEGHINPKSVLHQIVHGTEPAHIDMIDGLVVNLLKEKWKTYAKYRFRRRMAGFVLYFVVFVSAFLLRPATDLQQTTKTTNYTENGTVYQRNVTEMDPCYLNRVASNTDVVRFILEAMTLVLACVYLVLALKEIHHQGIYIFIGTLRTAPSKAMFLLSCWFIVFMVPGRASCSYQYEDIVAVLAMLFTAQYFLFFCRGLKIVGPFVVMIFKMVTGDLLRFFLIYGVFVIGFSQAMYVLFRGVEDTPFEHFAEAIMGMIVMSLGEFKDIYDSFEKTRNQYVGKFIFLVYMVLVTLLLINMLIAMMGNTYTLVNETQKEWLRQWGHIVLVMEQSVTTDERLVQQKKYTQKMADGRRALYIKWHQTDAEKAELARVRELHRLKSRNLLARKRDGRLVGERVSKPLVVQQALAGTVNV